MKNSDILRHISITRTRYQLSSQCRQDAAAGVG